MSETIQMRQTQQNSGDYDVYAAATVGGEQPVKGLALHHDITQRLDQPDYAEVEMAEDGGVELSPDKATTATVRFRTEDNPAVRHVYVSPDFLAQFGDFDFEGEDTDLDAIPSLAIDGITASTEDEYEADKEERSSAEDAADALLGESDDAEAEDGESEDSEDEEVELSDEEIGIVEN